MLALALINDPSIVFLDEPTTGLDPQSRRRFWQLIEMIKARGKTVVLTTHYMDEAEYLCDELMIIDHGVVIALGSPKDLLKQHFQHTRVCLDKNEFYRAKPTITEDVVETEMAVEILTQSVELTLQSLIAQRVNLTSLHVRNASLEDLFIKLTGHALRE